jgi:hypothetical protein
MYCISFGKYPIENSHVLPTVDEDQSESEPLSSSLQYNRSNVDGSLGATKSPLTSPMSAASETEEESRDGKHAFSFSSSFLFH